MRKQDKNDQPYSVVMAVYKNDKPRWLSQAIDSMLYQSVVPDEIILVVDGQIPKKLAETVDAYASKVTSVWLPVNKGLWNALNVGVKKARNELIARMDSDDIAMLNRTEKQLAAFRDNAELAILSGTVAEFTSSTRDITAYRKVPESHEAIVRFAKYRSPFNHPAVMFKKSAVLSVGGYAHLMRSEDYDLWTRMLHAGLVGANLPDTLLYYRVGSDNQSRKGTWIQQRELLQLYERSYAMGFLTLPEYIKAYAIRLGFAVVPSSVKRIVYSKALRR